MEKEDITLRVEGGIARVGIERGTNRNALTQRMVLRLTDIARQLSTDSAVRCVILFGTPEIFSAGIDLKDPEKWANDQLPFAEKRQIARRGPALCKAWEEMPQITFAVIEGINVGAGVALTLACDFRVQAEDACLLMPEVGIGIPVAWQTVPRLLRLIGPARTKRCLLWGERITAAMAHQWGLADELAPSGKAMARAEELAKKIAAMPFPAVAMTKESVNASANALNHAASYMDADQSTLIVLSGEMKR